MDNPTQTEIIVGCVIFTDTQTRSQNKGRGYLMYILVDLQLFLKSLFGPIPDSGSIKRGKWIPIGKRSERAHEMGGGE